MHGFNKVILAGNLTRDPELRYTPGGTAIAKGGIALNRQWTADGEKKQEVTFVDFVSFGGPAVLISEHLRKGMAYLVEGRLQTEAWQDKQTGDKRSKLMVVVEKVVFLPNGGNGDSDRDDDRPPAQQGRAAGPPARAKQPARAPDPEEDDVPF